jgi:hypothetical protein
MFLRTHCRPACSDPCATDQGSTKAYEPSSRASLMSPRFVRPPEPSRAPRPPCSAPLTVPHAPAWRVAAHTGENTSAGANRPRCPFGARPQQQLARRSLSCAPLALLRFSARGASHDASHCRFWSFDPTRSAPWSNRSLCPVGARGMDRAHQARRAVGEMPRSFVHVRHVAGEQALSPVSGIFGEAAQHQERLPTCRSCIATTPASL